MYMKCGCFYIISRFQAMSDCGNTHELLQNEKSGFYQSDRSYEESEKSSKNCIFNDLILTETTKTLRLKWATACIHITRQFSFEFRHIRRNKKYFYRDSLNTSWTLTERTREPSFERERSHTQFKQTGKPLNCMPYFQIEKLFNHLMKEYLCISI